MKLEEQRSHNVDLPREQKREPKKRFLIVKLEERIAPCHTNPHGKTVGCGNHGHHSCYCFCY